MSKQYYLDNVFPHVPEEVKAQVLNSRPTVRLMQNPPAEFTPLAEHNVIMLVGMTGSGKSTTLRELWGLADFFFTEAIPSRRQLADLILIPTAQHLNHEPIIPITDRVERFQYTRAAREKLIAGGTAEAFTWLHCKTGIGRILSEGVRGSNEIQYALKHTRWRIAELWVDPIMRLTRLSNRKETFDRVQNPDAEDLSFLPTDRQHQVRALITSGEITPTAIATVRAETINYGNAPFDMNNQTNNYRCFVTDDISPKQVASHIARWIKETQE